MICLSAKGRAPLSVFKLYLEKHFKVDTVVERITVASGTTVSLSIESCCRSELVIVNCFL